MKGHDFLLSIIRTSKDINFLRNTLFLEIGSDRESGSTKLLALEAKRLGMIFETVDPDKGANERSIKVLQDIDKTFTATLSLGEERCKMITSQVGLIYFDAFDIITGWPHKQSTIDSYKKRNMKLTNENAWKMHLEAAQNIYEKIVPRGIVVFDDTMTLKDAYDGKGKTAIPFLKSVGFDVIGHTPSAVALQKKK